MAYGSFQNCNCAYCKRNGGFPRHVYVRTINRNWFETPKNGTVSIKWGCKLNRVDVHAMNNTGKPSIVVYRDPVDRFRSTFLHYFHEDGLRYKSKPEKDFGNGIEFFNNLNYKIEELSLHERAEILLENLKKLDTRFEVHHWWPQVDFFNTDDIEIITIDKINETFNIKAILNQQKKVDFEFTNEQKNVIMDVYTIDYDWFEGKI